MLIVHALFCGDALFLPISFIAVLVDLAAVFQAQPKVLQDVVISTLGRGVDAFLGTQVVYNKVLTFRTRVRPVWVLDHLSYVIMIASVYLFVCVALVALILVAFLYSETEQVVAVIELVQSLAAAEAVREARRGEDKHWGGARDSAPIAYSCKCAV